MAFNPIIYLHDNPPLPILGDFVFVVTKKLATHLFVIRVFYVT